MTVEPAEFLRCHPPFDRLSPDARRRLDASLQIAYVPRSTCILQRGGARAQFLYVIRKGTVRLERDGQPLQVLEEGDCFGFPSLIGHSSPHADAVAAEDLLLFRIPEQTFTRLMEDPALAAFFLADLSDRLRHAATSQALPIGNALGSPVGQVSTRAPITVGPTATVGDAARIMRDAGVSSVLVEGTPPGILTDRDLRTRVLAAQLGPDTPVGAVATRPLRSIPADTTLIEALAFMLEHRVHHAPLERDGAIVGIITDADVLRLQASSPLYLLRSVEAYQVPGDLGRYAQELSAMVEALHWGGLDAAQIGPVVSRVNDALAARLLRQAEHDLGDPPTPYCWIALGAEGRREQALLTDQDNALVFAERTPRAEAYFAALADRMVDWLAAASFPRCQGGFMATNWNRPLDAWVRTFRSWIETPEPRALVEALNFFDYRPVHGALPLAPLDAVIRAAAGERIFLAHLARASLGLTPPLGAFRHIRQEEGGVDVKKGGILPICSLARLYALEAGSEARGTLARLDAAASAGTLSREGARTLAEAFRFLLGLRLREQLRALKAGEPVGNKVPLEHLSALECLHLKDVFLAIRESQAAAAIHHAVERLA